MHRHSILFSFIVISLITAGGSSCTNPGPAVTLSDGMIQGDVVGGARCFLKIPYAKPPVGDLRWKAPVKNDPWTGVHHEKEFACPCPQLKNQQNAGSTNEDCLYLNVWTPEPAPTKAPVMVWFHGGGNFAGSAGDKLPVVGLSTDEQPLWYDGQYFASKQGIIVVTLNYRLSVMGFFAHAGLAAEGSPLGNQGLLDQRRALQWVHDNIEKFGGDPNNITIFGESAGSFDVASHVVSEGSRGLFHRAISESGGITGPGSGKLYPTPSDEASKIDALAKDLGCTGTDASSQLACLRHVSVADMLNAAGQTDPVINQAAKYSFGAVVDGPGGFFTDQPRTLFDQGKIAKVPYLLGSNTDEGTLFTLFGSSSYPSSEQEYEAELTRRFGSQNLQELLKLYPAVKFNNDYHAALTRAVGDQTLVNGTHDTARCAHKAGSKVFMYNFNIPWNITPSYWGPFFENIGNALVGACHSSEITFVFDIPYNPTASDQFVADTVNTFWATFARTGDPNFSGAPAIWPEFTPDANDNDLRLQLDAEWQILANFRKEECAFWRSYNLSQ